MNSESNICVKMVGVGCAGLRLLDRVAAAGFPASDFLAVDSDCEHLQRCQIAERIQLGETNRRGWGCSGDEGEGANCVRAARDRIAGKLMGADLVVIVAGMGGGIGGGGAPVVAEIASEGGALVLALAIEPFDLEGRNETAQVAVNRLTQVADTVVLMPNQNVMETLGKGASVPECMEAANGHVLEALMGMGRLARTDGELNADFAHVRGLMTGYHGESSLVTVEVAGDARPRALLEAILKHPYFNPDSEFRHCEGLIVSLVGDESMSMEEVDEFMAHLKATASRAKVILGVHVDDAMGKGMGAMVLMPRRPLKAVPPASVKRERLQISMPEPSRTQPASTRDFQQQQLPLVPISKGRFDKGEPNLHDGDDLDVPTFLRRNMILN